MALKKVGNRIVLEGAATYISNAFKVGAANKRVGDSGGEAADGLDKMSVKSIALGSFLGGLFLQTLNKVGRSIMGFGQQAVGVTVQYERLEMSMSSLVAKEIMMAEKTDDMTEALEMASPRAKELLKWIQELAIKSPFDQQGVAMAFKTAMAYGFTSSEAQKLAKASIDFTTATGASGHVMSQIALALGQIKAKGKAAGQEMLQLVNAGINTNQMLKDMGYTLEDVSKGLVSADEFTQQFLDTMEKDFGGAAERSSETLGGLLNTLGDIKEMALKAIFTPVFKAVTPHLGELLGKAQQLIPYLEVIGENLGKMAMFLIENRTAVIQVVGVLTALVGTFVIAINAGTILSGVLAVMTGLVTGLGGAIAFLLSPVTLVAAGIAALAGAFALIGVGIMKAREAQAQQLDLLNQEMGDKMDQRANIAANAEQQRLDAMGEMGDKIQQQQAQDGQAQSEEAHYWGQNIVKQFAQGMATAISAVISVLADIGRAISYWLSPGSPPRILPDLPEWGTSAMNEFLGGFTNADFSIFSGISGTLRGLIGSMDLSPEKSITRTLDMRKAVMGAVNEFKETGKVGPAAYDAITAAVGDANPAIAQYAKGLVDAQIAQEKLNKITEKYDEMLSPLTGRLSEIQKERDKYQTQKRIAELQKIAADPNAEGDARRFALLELEELSLKDQVSLIEEKRKAEAEAAAEELKAAQEKMALAQQQLQIQQETNTLLKQLADLMKPDGGSGGADGKKGGPGGVADTAAKAFEDAMGAGGTIPQALENFKTNIAQLAEDIKAPFAGIGQELTDLGSVWLQTFEDLGWTFPNLKLRATEFAHGFALEMLGVISFLQARKKTWEGNFELMGIAVRKLKLRNRLLKQALIMIWNEIRIKMINHALNWRLKMIDMQLQMKLLQIEVKKQSELIKLKFYSMLLAVQTFWNRLKSLKEWVETNVINVLVEAVIPPELESGSPLKIHTKLMDFEKYLKKTDFVARTGVEDTGGGSFPARAGQILRSNVTTINNNQRIQAVGEANVRGESDLAALEAIIERVVVAHIG